MRKLLLFAAAVLIATAVMAPTLVRVQGPPRLIINATPPSSLNTGLIAYWALEEGSGVRGDDEPTGTPQDLTDNNTVTSVAGINGNAAYFTEANAEHLSHVDSADLSVGNIDFSVTAWCKGTTLNGNAVIVSHYKQSSSHRAWRLWFNSAIGKYAFTVSNDGAATADVNATVFGTPPTNVFHFVAAWHDSVANVIGISVNDGTPNTLAYALGVFDAPAAFYIGGRDPGSDLWDGAIDEVAFFKKVLTSAEITELYNGGAGKFCCPF